ncbi:hypothetical protein SLA2020_158640 [Shorea laevis]
MALISTENTWVFIFGILRDISSFVVFMAPIPTFIGFGRRNQQRGFNHFHIWLDSSVPCFGSTMHPSNPMLSFSSLSTPLVAWSKPFTLPSTSCMHQRKLGYLP